MVSCGVSDTVKPEEDQALPWRRAAGQGQVGGEEHNAIIMKQNIFHITHQILMSNDDLLILMYFNEYCTY